MKTRFILQSIVGTLVLCAILTGSAQGQNQYQSRNLGGPSVKQSSHPTASGVCYAILIGVNDYKHQKQLQFCAKDMTGLKKALVDGKVVEDKRITLLVSGAGEESQPTLANINRALKNLAGETNENDTILFAFAGHGVSLPSRKGGTDFQQYLCPTDAEIILDSDTGRFETDSLLALADIDHRLTKEVKAKTRIMFLDACRDKEFSCSTRSMGGLNKAADLISNTNFASGKLATSGLYRLSSCSSDQKSFEDTSTKHGAFSLHLIKGLNGDADKKANGGNGDGQITLIELNKYVSEETKSFVWGKWEETQEPTFSMDDCRGDPLMAKCEPEKVAQASLPNSGVGPNPNPSPRPSPNPSPRPRPTPPNPKS